MIQLLYHYCSLLRKNSEKTNKTVYKYIYTKMKINIKSTLIIKVSVGIIGSTLKLTVTNLFCEIPLGGTIDICEVSHVTDLRPSGRHY